MLHDFHFEGLLGLPIKENKTRDVSRAGTFSIIQSIFLFFFCFFFSEMAENLGTGQIPAQLSNKVRKLYTCFVPRNMAGFIF